MGFINPGQLYNELKNRFDKNITCPHLRQVQTVKCCNGWSGELCDKRN